MSDTDSMKMESGDNPSSVPKSEMRESGDTDWEALNQAKRRLDVLEAGNHKTNDADELIDLLEEAESFLEDLSLGYYTDLQIKLSKTRYRLLKEREAKI